MFGRKKMAKTSFDSSRMPHNRIQVFSDVYRNRFKLITKLGFIALLFFVPLIAVTVLTNLKVYEIGLSLSAGTLTSEQAAVAVFGFINAGNLLNIPAITVFAIGLSGIFGVVRRLVWQEGVLFSYDFWNSVKENSPTFCLTTAIGGTLNYLVQYALRNSYFRTDAGAETAVIASLAAAALLLPAIPFIFTQCTLYKLSFPKKFVNAFLLSMRAAYKTFPALLLNIAPFLLLLIPSEYVYLPLLLLLPVFAVPALALFDILFCDTILDRYVNKSNFPEIYDKGIWRNAEDTNG